MEGQGTGWGWAGNMIEQSRGGMKGVWVMGAVVSGKAGHCPSLKVLPHPYWVPSTILKALHALPHLNCMSAL